MAEFDRQSVNMKLKNRLKELRARDGLNQTELAKLAGISRQTISLLERDEYTPSIIIALKICQKLFHNLTPFILFLLLSFLSAQILN